MANSLNPRQKNVLTALVDHYIVKAVPVSSKILSQSPILSASSATIRNTMVELEGLGMVEQPHASAGRLPTDLGYRVYVDELMYPQPLAASDKKSLDLQYIYNLLCTPSRYSTGLPPERFPFIIKNSVRHSTSELMSSF